MNGRKAFELGTGVALGTGRRLLLLLDQVVDEEADGGDGREHTEPESGGVGAAAHDRAASL